VLLEKFENECRSSGKNLHAKIYGVSMSFAGIGIFF
jgi:hypothetical protein